MEHITANFHPTFRVIDPKNAMTSIFSWGDIKYKKTARSKECLISKKLLLF